MAFYKPVKETWKDGSETYAIAVSQTEDFRSYRALKKRTDFAGDPYYQKVRFGSLEDAKRFISFIDDKDIIQAEICD